MTNGQRPRHFFIHFVETRHAANVNPIARPLATSCKVPGARSSVVRLRRALNTGYNYLSSRHSPWCSPSWRREAAQAARAGRRRAGTPLTGPSPAPQPFIYSPPRRGNLDTCWTVSRIYPPRRSTTFGSQWSNSIGLALMLGKMG